MSVLKPDDVEENMRFNLDKAMGIHEQALYVRARRSSILASNLANADTPNYKARDIDFKAVLSGIVADKGPGRLARTQPGHIQPGGTSVRDSELLYRIPYQASVDGNTVDAQVEKSEFTQNALRYQASLQFLGSKIKGLMKAIKGE